MNILKNNVCYLGFLAFCTICYATGAFAADVNAELVSAFQSFCSTQTPDFEALDKKATAMGFAVKSENLPKDNMANHSKTWTANSGDVTYDLSVAEAFGAGGHSIFCGLAQPDADSAAFRETLVSQMKLGTPSSQKTSANGMRVTTWGYQGDGATLMYTDAPTSPKGLIVNMLYTLPPKN